MTRRRSGGFNEDALEIGVLRSNIAYELNGQGQLMQVRLCETGKGCSKLFEWVYKSTNYGDFPLDASCGNTTVNGRYVLCPECVAKLESEVKP